MINHCGDWAARGNLGSIGMDMDYERQYTVSVKKRDTETAKYLVNQVLHPEK